MNDLSPEARRMLAQARSGQALASQALRARVKQSVLREVAAAPPPQAASAGAWRTFAGLPAWTLPTLGAVAVIGSIATFAARGPAEVPAPLARSTDPMSQTPSLPAEDEPARAEDNMPPADPPPLEAESPASQARRPKIRRQPSHTRDLDSELRAEMQLLARAEAALRAHEAQSALSILDAHARELGSGQLRGERDGLRLIAQCALGRDPHSALVRYLGEHRDGVLQARIRSSCARFLP